MPNRDCRRLNWPRRRLCGAFAGLLLGGAAPRAGSAARQPAAPGSGVEDQVVLLRDPRLASGPVQRYCQVYAPRSGPLAVPRRDNKLNRDFLHHCVVRAWDSPVAAKEVRFRLHFTTPEDEPLARRVARVLGRVYWLGMEYLWLPRPRQGPDDRWPVDVWLTREGQPGAEQFRDDIYLYAVAEDRAPAEWIREIAHEYAHLVLPPAGPFSAPERWANGYLGERLFLKWLIDNDEAAVWGTPFQGWSYLANQVAPLRDRFLNAGPTAAVALRTDAVGMEHYIGMALAIEATYGPRLLREALHRAPNNLPASLSAGLAAALQADAGEVRVDPRAVIPGRSAVEASQGGSLRARRACYWLFLPEGAWGITLRGALPAGVTAFVEGTAERLALPAAAGGATLDARVGTAGWRRLMVQAAPGASFELAQLELQRRAAQ